MKIRHSSRIVAIALALMMIVPLVSIPVFAAEGDVLYSESFENITNVADAVKPQSPNNNSGFIKRVGGSHGKAFYYDLSGGPTKELMDDGKEKLYITTTGEEGTWYALDEYTINADGTISGVNVELGLCVEHEAPGTGRLDKRIVVYNCTNVKQVHARDEYGDEIIGEDDYPVWTYEYTKGPAKALTYYFATSQVKAQILAEGNIATQNTVQHSAITAKQVTYSMDLYLDAALQNKGDGHAVGGLAPLWSWSKSGMNFTIGLHEEVSKTAADATGDSVEVAANQWFNLSVYVDYETAFVAVYVNGNFVQSATISSDLEINGQKVADAIKAQAGNIPAAQWNLFQVNSNVAADAVAGYIMADNIAISEGSVIPAASKIPTTVTGNTFSSDLSNVTDANKGAMTLQGGIGSKPIGDKALLIDTSILGENTAVNVGTRLTVADSIGYNAAGVNTNTIVLQCDYYFPSGHNAIINVTAPNWTGSCQEADHTVGPHRENHLTLYRITAEGSKLVIPKRDHAGVPNAAVLTSGVTADLPFNEWFTITVVINAETGDARLYWTSEAGVTTLMYTYKMMDRGANHSEITISTFSFSKLNGSGTGTYAVDNACIYTDETQRPGYSASGAAVVFPDIPAVTFPDNLPTSTIAGTDFSDLTGVTDGDKAGSMSLQGGVGGKTDDDKAFVIDTSVTTDAAAGTATAVNVGTQLTVTGGVGYNAPAYNRETIVLQADYYFPSGHNAIVNVTAPNWTGTCLTEHGSGGAHRENHLTLYRITAEGDVLVIPKRDHAGVPSAAVLESATNNLPYDEWFTITVVINAKTGDARLYWTSEAGVTTLMYTYKMMDRGVNHSEITISSFAFAKLSTNYTGTYAVDNVCIYTDESERPGYVASNEGGEVPAANEKNRVFEIGKFHANKCYQCFHS